MLKPHCYVAAVLIPVFAVLAGCATKLPPAYTTTGSGKVLDGPVLAIAGEGDLVAAVNASGLFIKKGDGSWVRLEAPGIKEFSLVTSLLVHRGDVYLGSDGEGLHIYTNGEWEVKNSRYGGLADDGVLCITLDREDSGLPGSTIWIGTREGIAARHGSEWKVYVPGKDWLVTMTGRSAAGVGRVYLGSGFKLGKKEEDSRTFRPPVTAIGVGVNTVVFGNGRSRIAMVGHSSVATFSMMEDLGVTRLIVDEPVVWAGTDKGLVWGGLRGEALGKPWPTHRGYLLWSGKLFGSRDSRPFEYRWKILGYNTATVADLAIRNWDLWVAYNAKGVSRARQGGNGGPDRENKISGVRLYPSLSDFIVRREIPQFENYGMNIGIKGEPTVLYAPVESNRVWIGTTKGLWELER